MVFNNNSSVKKKILVIEEEFLTLVKDLNEIEFKTNLLYLTCNKDDNKWNDQKKFSKIYK